MSFEGLAQRRILGNFMGQETPHMLVSLSAKGSALLPFCAGQKAKTRG